MGWAQGQWEVNFVTFPEQCALQWTSRTAGVVHICSGTQLSYVLLSQVCKVAYPPASSWSLARGHSSCCVELYQAISGPAGMGLPPVYGEAWLRG